MLAMTRCMVAYLTAMAAAGQLQATEIQSSRRSDCSTSPTLPENAEDTFDDAALSVDTAHRATTAAPCKQEAHTQSEDWFTQTQVNRQTLRTHRLDSSVYSVAPSSEHVNALYCHAPAPCLRRAALPT